MDDMERRVKEVVSEDAEKLKKLTRDAAKSGAYLYPIRGIFYFVSHKSLWKPLSTKLIPTFTLGGAVTVGLFMVAYLPQAAVMAFTQGPLAAITAAVLTLSEASTLTTVLARTFLVGDALVDTFDGTLVAREETALVSAGRQIKGGTGDPIGRLGKMIKRPFSKFTPKALIRYVLYLPLNFIPVVGTVMFVLLQGKKNGPAAHDRYFQLKGWGTKQTDKFIDERRGAYTSFGVAATLLEMVPVASILFSFTNSVGAALWAADIEKGNVDEKGTSPEVRKDPSGSKDL